MGKKKIITEEGKLVETAILTGALDRDLPGLQKAVQSRLREVYKSSGWSQTPADLELGQLIRFREDVTMRYHPQYLKGAVCKVVASQNQWRAGALALEIVELQRKPRGGFGQPARYDIGAHVEWWYDNEIEPFDTEEAKRELEAQIEKIKRKHQTIAP